MISKFHCIWHNEGQLANTEVRRTVVIGGVQYHYIIYHTKKHGVRGFAFKQANADFKSFPIRAFHNDHEPLESIPLADKLGRQAAERRHQDDARRVREREAKRSKARVEKRIASGKVRPIVDLHDEVTGAH
jgi:hypothetical protein